MYERTEKETNYTFRYMRTNSSNYSKTFHSKVVISLSQILLMCRITFIEKKFFFYVLELEKMRHV